MAPPCTIRTFVQAIANGCAISLFRVLSVVFARELLRGAFRHAAITRKETIHVTVLFVCVCVLVTCGQSEMGVYVWPVQMPK